MVFARTTPALISSACTVWVGAGTGTTTAAGGEDTTGASIRTWLAETIATGTVNATAATAPVSSLFLVAIVSPSCDVALVASAEERPRQPEVARPNANCRLPPRSARVSRRRRPERPNRLPLL